MFGGQRLEQLQIQLGDSAVDHPDGQEDTACPLPNIQTDETDVDGDRSRLSRRKGQDLLLDGTFEIGCH